MKITEEFAGRFRVICRSVYSIVRRPARVLQSAMHAGLDLVMTRTMATTSASRPHTKAWTAFEQNLDSILHMLALTRRELAAIKTATTRFATSVTRMTTEVARLKTLVGNSPDLPVRPLETAVTKLTRSSERYNRTLQTGRERMATATLWQVVMLVTCVEAYLQDLLAIAASVDPKLMAESQQVAPYADVISATSLDELASELRARWARGWLRKGGPTSWISRLEKMGARGYPDGLAPRLERIWGIRHVVVHAAGVATADFVKRYPGVVAAAGDRVQVGSRDFGAFIESVKGFMEPTERYFVRRYPSLLAETVTERVK